MKTLRTIGLALSIASALLLPNGSARADDRPMGPPLMRDHRPYGGYCKGPQWGWYGARTQVRTEREARRHLVKFFEGQDVTIGPITERERFFRAVILNAQDQVVDHVIINKRTGRIRSLY